MVTLWHCYDPCAWSHTYICPHQYLQEASTKGLKLVGHVHDGASQMRKLVKRFFRYETLSKLPCICLQWLHTVLPWIHFTELGCTLWHCVDCTLHCTVLHGLHTAHNCTYCTAHCIGKTLHNIAQHWLHIGTILASHRHESRAVNRSRTNCWLAALESATLLSS